MPIQIPMVFLLIAEHEGISANVLCHKTGLSQSAISRNIALLSEKNSKASGLGLVRKTINAKNQRAHAIYLTDAGRALMFRLAKTMEKAAAETANADCDLFKGSQNKPSAIAGMHWELWVN